MSCQLYHLFVESLAHTLSPIFHPLPDQSLKKNWPGCRFTQCMIVGSSLRDSTYKCYKQAVTDSTQDATSASTWELKDIAILAQHKLFNFYEEPLPLYECWELKSISNAINWALVVVRNQVSTMALSGSTMEWLRCSMTKHNERWRIVQLFKKFSGWKCDYYNVLVCVACLCMIIRSERHYQNDRNITYFERSNVDGLRARIFFENSQHGQLSTDSFPWASRRS